MRTTVRIDDDLLRDLKQQAQREGVSLTQVVNRALRCGLTSQEQPRKPPRPYREKTFRMGVPEFNLDKALALAAALEDEEILKEMAAGK